MIFANVNLCNCNCSYLTISNGASENPHNAYITTWIRTKFTP